MSSGLLSLKWNNHKSTFFHVLSTIRSKESYCDVTLACDGRFYSLHKFVLSTCSEYFEEMFERTQCKHPVIVLKDINSEDLEALLNYMYVGEVNVVQEKLAGLIKAAECLKIKGLAVPDEDPMESKDNSSIDRERHKRSQRGEDSPRAKRRRRENSSDVSEEILSPVRSRPSARSREHHGSQSAKSAAAAVAPSEENEDGSRETHALTDASEEAENSSINANRQTDSSSNKTNSSQSSSHKKEVVPEEVTLDDEHVKSEPLDLDNDDTGENDPDNKDGLHHDLGFDASDTMGGADDEGNYVDVDPSMLGGNQPQSVEDVVAQAMPGSSGFQGNSFPLWEGDGSLSGFPSDGFSGDSSQARQMGSVMGSSAVSTAAERYLSASGAAGGGGGSSPDAPPPTALLRQWQCPYCSKLFIKKFNLLTHVRIHTGERPFACPHCSYRANHSSHLKTHVFKVHNTPMVASSTSSSTSAAANPVVLFSLEKSSLSRVAAGSVLPYPASSTGVSCLSLASLSECLPLPSNKSQRRTTSEKPASSKRPDGSDEQESFSSRDQLGSDDGNDANPMDELVFLSPKRT